MLEINREELIKIRRDLHKIPEPSGEEFKTAEYIRRKLSEFGIEYKACAETGTVAFIRGAKPGKTVLLRADIDALPIEENNNLPYKSVNKGFMHACGHDIHTACALYAGKMLNELKDRFCGNVRLVFQPREETDGGAEQMISEGVMNPCVDAALALHVEPLEACGYIQIKDGAVMASPDDFEIEIIGRGGHGATPHECVNPINVAAAIIESFAKIPSLYFSAQDPCVVTICSVEGGSCPNVIPETVTLLGTARSLDEETRERLAFVLEDTAKKVCGLFGAECKFVFNKRFPPTVNDKAMNELVANAAGKLKEVKGITYLKNASMCGDDFAYFARLVPSAYFKLGVGNETINKPIHSPEFMADEDALVIGSKLLVQSALDYLNG